MARAALKLGVREVAKAAKISPATLSRVEADQPANASTLAAIRAALEAAGVEFIEENAAGPGVRLAPGRSSAPSNPEFLALLDATRQHGLVLRPRVPAELAAQFEYRRGPVAPVMAFDGALKMVWEIVGDAANVKTFLGACGVALTAYLGTRGARSVRIKGGDVEVEIKGSADVKRAMKAFHSVKELSRER